MTPRKKPGDQAGERADDGGDPDGDERDERRVGDAGCDPGEDVAAELVGAEPVVDATAPAGVSAGPAVAGSYGSSPVTAEQR